MRLNFTKKSPFKLFFLLIFLSLIDSPIHSQIWTIFSVKNLTYSIGAFDPDSNFYLDFSNSKTIRYELTPVNSNMRIKEVKVHFAGGQDFTATGGPNRFAFTINEGVQIEDGTSIFFIIKYDNDSIISTSAQLNLVRSYDKNINLNGSYNNTLNVNYQNDYLSNSLLNTDTLCKNGDTIIATIATNYYGRLISIDTKRIKTNGEYNYVWNVALNKYVYDAVRGGFFRDLRLDIKLKLQDPSYTPLVIKNSPNLKGLFIYENSKQNNVVPIAIQSTDINMGDTLYIYHSDDLIGRITINRIRPDGDLYKGEISALSNEFDSLLNDPNVHLERKGKLFKIMDSILFISRKAPLIKEIWIDGGKDLSLDATKEDFSIIVKGNNINLLDKENYTFSSDCFELDKLIKSSDAMHKLLVKRNCSKCDTNEKRIMITLKKNKDTILDSSFTISIIPSIKDFSIKFQNGRNESEPLVIRSNKMDTIIFSKLLLGNLSPCNPQNITVFVQQRDLITDSIVWRYSVQKIVEGNYRFFLNLSDKSYLNDSIKNRLANLPFSEINLTYQHTETKSSNSQYKSSFKYIPAATGNLAISVNTLTGVLFPLDNKVNRTPTYLSGGTVGLIGGAEFYNRRAKQILDITAGFQVVLKKDNIVSLDSLNVPDYVGDILDYGPTLKIGINFFEMLNGNHVNLMRRGNTNQNKNNTVYLQLIKLDAGYLINSQSLYISLGLGVGFNFANLIKR